MAPFSIPVPHIVPLQLTILGGPKTIDTNIKIQLLCDTYLQHEIFYTIDGTKPQPYAGIVQGNKTIKYSSPFCLPAGKITIKALAVNANIHTMRSNILTKCFDVLKADPPQSPKKQLTKNLKKKHDVHNKICDEIGKQEQPSNNEDNVLTLNPLIDENKNCLDDAFIASTDLESESNNKESDIEDAIESSYNSDISETRMCQKEIEDLKLDKDVLDGCVNDRTALEEYLHSDDEINMMMPEDTRLHNLENIHPQFCCQKCDKSLQQCFACKRINTVSSKFCIECGIQLVQMCIYCKEHNPCFAVYCQVCGRKLDQSSNKHSKICSKVDHSTIAKPNLKTIGVQRIPLLFDKCTQTVRESALKKNSPKFDRNRLPRQSPGRGYWHQQLDYICNHLKSHAYNNMDFRKVMSDPILCDFQSAQINKEENSVTVTMIFSQLVVDKNACQVSTYPEIKAKDKT